jgi:hypothetical protein
MTPISVDASRVDVVGAIMDEVGGVTEEDALTSRTYEYTAKR